MPIVASQSASSLHPMAHFEPAILSPTHYPKTVSASSSPRQAINSTLVLPPPGARPPVPPMSRRGSRFDPMNEAPEEDAQDELGPRHPLRRIREDAVPERERERAAGDCISLPGIKALLNAADQPPLASPFTPSFTQSPVNSNTSIISPLDSPTSRSRFSSFASSNEGGWWAPEDRSGSSASSYRQSHRGSYSARGSLDDGPEVKRRRSDMAPTPPDADEMARLKWQAQSRNASFPASGSMSSSSGLRGMLYPPPSSLSTMSRGSISGIAGTPLASPLSSHTESPFDFHHPSSRNSPMTGPLARSFADLSASSPPAEPLSHSRNRSPVGGERRPSMLSRASRSNESIPQLPHLRESVPGPILMMEPQRMSLTRPPSPEAPTRKDTSRRASLADLIRAQSGDDVALNLGGGRRESTESIHSVISLPSGPFRPELEHPTPRVTLDRRAAIKIEPHDPRRPFEGGVDDEEMVDPQSDPAMRGMEVLAESARRVADAERKDSTEDRDQRESSPSKGSGPSTGPKYSCAYCAKTFSRPSSLRIHTYSHTGERPFVCKEPTCRRRFSVQSNLKRHAKVHQLQAQQAQIPNQHQQPRAPPPQHMHGGPAPPPQHMYDFGRPPHPHMAHPPHHPPSGYGPAPPPGYRPPPGAGYNSMPPQQPQQPHYSHGPRPGPPPSEHMQAHYRELQRRQMQQQDHDGSGRSGGGPGRHGGNGSHPPGPGADGEWGSEEEEDELDEEDE